MKTSVVGERHVRVVRLRAIYDCEDMCGRTRTSPGDPTSRAAYRCSLPDFDPARWDPTADRLAAADAGSALGELEALAHVQRVDLDHDLDRDGCPWGWVVCGFASSVSRYMGQRSADSPIRTTSAWMLARLAQPGPMPTRILEAVDLAEAHENNAYAHYHKVINGG